MGELLLICGLAGIVFVIYLALVISLVRARRRVAWLEADGRAAADSLDSLSRDNAVLRSENERLSRAISVIEHYASAARRPK